MACAGITRSASHASTGTARLADGAVTMVVGCEWYHSVYTGVPRRHMHPLSVSWCTCVHPLCLWGLLSYQVGDQWGMVW